MDVTQSGNPSTARVETVIRETALPIFVLLTFLFSWPLWFASGVLTRDGVGSLDFGWLVAQIGAFAPSLAALFLSILAHDRIRARALRMMPIYVTATVLGLIVASAKPDSFTGIGTSSSLLAVAFAVVVVLFFASTNRGLLMGGAGERRGITPVRWAFLATAAPLILYLIAWFFTNVRTSGWEIAILQKGGWESSRSIAVIFSMNLLFSGSLGEEIGWRGFFLPRLLRKYHPLGASLILGLIWALWHAPIDLTSGFLMTGPVAVLIRILWTLPLTILFTWFYLRSGGSVLVALLLHTSLNVLSDFGFSNHELSTLGFFILFALAAILVSCSRVMREGPKEDPRRHQTRIG